MVILKKILFIILGIVSLELFCYLYAVSNLLNNIISNKQEFYPSMFVYNINLNDYQVFYNDHVKKEFRKNNLYHTDKKPILILGDSFAYGFGLKDDKTFGSMLSKITNRTVYNKAINGSSLAHMILLLRNEDLYKEVEEPEYCILVFQLRPNLSRLWRYQFFVWDNYLYPRFELKNGELVYAAKRHWYSGLYFYRVLKYFQTTSVKQGQYTREKIDFIVKHFEVIDSDIHKRWNNTKLVILFYNQGIEPEMFNNLLKTELTKKQFYILDTKDIVGINLDGDYTIGDKYMHPSSKAWDILSVKLSEKLKL